MKRIAELLAGELCYIYGDKESGPNGAKKEFLNTSYAFLKKLAADLGFKESKVQKNASGIACSGEVTLRGMWADGNGLRFEITQSPISGNQQLYSPISGMKDFSSGAINQYIQCSTFANADYVGLCRTLLTLKKGAVANVA